MNKKNLRIAIYTGPMVSSAQLKHSLKKRFNNAVIIHLTKDNYTNALTCTPPDIFFLPGIVGETSPYSDDFANENNVPVIQSYVENGGIFVGVCAGAYFSADRILYNPPWLLEPKEKSPPLNFFNGLARGPMLPNGYEYDPANHWYSDCSVTEISLRYAGSSNQKSAHVIYGNGPALYPDTCENLNVIARYKNVIDNPIAIATRQIGDGMAMFLGVIPYLGYMDVENKPGLERLVSLMNEIQPYEDERLAIWHNITNIMQDHCDKPQYRGLHL